MSRPRTVLTTLAMLVVAGFVVAMMIVLRMVGQDLSRLKETHRDTASGLAGVEKATEELRVELQRARRQQARLADEAKRASQGIEALRGDLKVLEARVKAIEDAPPRADVTRPLAAPPAAVAPAPGPAVHPAELPAAVRANPPPVLRAASRALREKGIAGFCAALGLDDEAQARFRKAYEAFLPQARAAEKTHAKVAIQGDAVVIAIEPYHGEGHALLERWRGLLAQALTPAQQQAYTAAHGDAILFQRPFGHYTERITLTRDARGVKFSHRGTRLGGGGNTFRSAGTMAGAGAVDRLPWRHLLPDEAVAKLRGVAAER